MLVPYRPEHLPNYHEWMQDPDLLEATASEALTMDDEIQMQREWRDDEKKCTFIILARDLMDTASTNEHNSDNSIIPPPPNKATPDEKKSYPQLVDQTLDAMIGDINLFLTEEELEESEDDDEQSKPIERSATNHLSQAELDIMIAAPTHRHKNLGAELALTMMHYAATRLQIRRFFVKIKETNHSSLRLFKEKLGFLECAYVKCFGEYELECKCDTSSEMVDWVNRRWCWWCSEGKSSKGNDPAVIASYDEGGNGGNQTDGSGAGDDECITFRMYDVLKCPLNSSQW